MRAQLNNLESIPTVIADMTTEEKVNLLGAYTALGTKPYPELNIPPIYLSDGATGINGSQIVNDFVTSPDNVEHLQELRLNSYELMGYLKQDLNKVKEKYADNQMMKHFFEHLSKFNCDKKSFISFPSGINIGATWNDETAHNVGKAVGWEMRDSNIDVCLGPNVDIMRDPLGGRNYEMYGEDPHLVSETSVAFVNGMQETGVGASAKHFIANNQETRRNTKDTHVSERVLQEIYAPGFKAVVQKAKIKTVMTAYNAINGVFSSYNHTLLSDWLKDDWGYDGVVVSDWGAARKEKDKSLLAGMDLILQGPNDMSDCIAAVENGTLPMEVVDESVRRVLEMIVSIKEEQKQIPAQYNEEAILKAAYDTIVDGCVLLKNENHVLPLNSDTKVTFWGRRSKEMMEFGTGSTAVITSRSSNVYEEAIKLCGKNNISFEQIEGADTLVYTVTAPAGENFDRSEMDVETEDKKALPKVLKEAKEKGLKTVVILNVSGPVDMRSWIDYADTIFSIFVPGCMGGVAASDILFGKAIPAGKLPVTFPIRYEDSPSYPNFPGEHDDVYYGEGLFIGYRNYDKKQLPVQFPFGFGLNYTDFEIKTVVKSYEFDLRSIDKLAIPIKIKNVGKMSGSEVLQLYVEEVKPNMLRPLKELKAYKKVYLQPGVEQTITLMLHKENLACYHQETKKWITPIGSYRLHIGTSCEEILFVCDMNVQGENPYQIGPNTLFKTVLENQQATDIISRFIPGILNISEAYLGMLCGERLSQVLGMMIISAIPDAVKANNLINEIYKTLAEIK